MIEMKTQKSGIIVSKSLRNFWKAIIFVSCLLLVIISCTNDDKPEKIGAIIDRSKLPKLHVTDVTTVISDSGVTRYRISSSRWDIYDKVNQPYWEFPNGIHFEKFDENLNINANIRSNYAKFYVNEQIWELRGKVKSTNLQGEVFETEQLFWNQRLEKFYSDSLTKITRATQILTGTGFVSNQSMTQYTFMRPQGPISFNENPNSSDSIATSSNGSVGVKPSVGVVSSLNAPAKIISSINEQNAKAAAKKPIPAKPIPTMLIPIPQK